MASIGKLGRHTSAVPQRTRRLRFAVVIAVVAAAVATGWLWAGRSTSAPPQGWQPTSADLRLLHQAEEVAIQGCMAKMGFHYHVQPYVDDADRQRFPFVVDDVAWARVHGYGAAAPEIAPDDINNGPDSPEMAELPGAAQEAFTAALYGTSGDARVIAVAPTGDRMAHSTAGCQAQAEDDLYGDFSAWYADSVVVNNLPGMAAGSTVSDPLVTSAKKSWAACMRAAGHAVDDPRVWRLQLPPEDRQSSTGSTERRREYAVTEAACASSTGYGTVSRTVYQRNLGALQKQYRSAVRQEAEMRYRALPEARRIVAADNR